VHITGVKAFHIVFGGVNENKFIEFIIDRIVPILRPYPEPFSVLLLDNVQFHKTAALKYIVDDIGAVIVFIPRYCPKLNLAEYSFRDSKQIERVKGITGEYESLLSLSETLVSLRNKNYSKELRKCGYI